MGLEALCYVVLLVMPVLGRMSDQQEDVRLMASRCFASLVTLMPLEVGIRMDCEGVTINNDVLASMCIWIESERELKISSVDF